MAEVELQDFRSETRAWLDENCPDTVRGTGMLGGFGGGKKAPTPSSDFMKWFDRMWVSISPIVLISGQSPFCQCFFDDVKVPKEDLVGELDRGWTIAKRLLQHERASISGFSSGAGARATRGGAGSLKVLAKQYMGESNRIGNDEIRADVTKVNMGARAFQLTQRRAHEENREDGTPTFATSMFKLYGSELGKRRGDNGFDSGLPGHRLGRRSLFGARDFGHARVA